MSDRRVLMLVSGNSFPESDWSHHTARLWRETARKFDSIHIFARAEDQAFHRSSNGNMHLHLIPRGPLRMFTFFLTSWWLPVVMLKVRPTHLQAQSPVYGGLAAVFFAKRFKVPVLLELHGEHYFRAGQVGDRAHRWFFRPCAGIAFRGATIIRSLSSEMTQEIRNVYGEGAASRVVEIPNRVDLEVFSPPKRSYTSHGPLRIVSVGALNTTKNQLALIRDLAASRIDCRLCLVGSGSLEDRLRTEARMLGVPLEIRGGLSHPEVYECLLQQDVYVHYSRSEAVSRAVLEAMAVGLPVIVGPAGFMGGIIESDRTGIRLASLNQRQLAVAISRVCDATVRERLGGEARSQIEEHHEWKAVFEQYVNSLLAMSIA